MLSYAVALLACLILLYNNSTSNNNHNHNNSPRSIRRTPRPQVNESLLALEEDPISHGLKCPQDVGYSVHLVSKEPLVVYIENFISKEERAHLLEIRWVSIFLVFAISSLASIYDQSDLSFLDLLL